ncbi:MAG: alpha/beta fold hydrolase [Solirubrobacterales bacterium]
MLTHRTEQWRQQGEMVEISGRSLFVRSERGDKPLLLFLHGFPSSSWDWRELIGHGGHASLAFDCLGFGLSDKPYEHDYTLGWQADAAEELVRREGSPPVFVVAHDMGTSVATELMARDLRGELDMTVAGMLLFNGGILLDRITPTWGQKVLRGRFGKLASLLTIEPMFRRQFGSLFSHAHPLTAEEAADQWALLRHNGGHVMLHRTIAYMDERERLAGRWHGAFRDWGGPLSLTWGMRDPVSTASVLSGLRKLRPNVPLTSLPDLGHYPQIEGPAALAAVLDEALSRASTS